MASSRRARIVLWGSLTFALATFGAITVATHNPQIGLHAACWITLVFALWLDMYTSR